MIDITNKIPCYKGDPYYKGGPLKDVRINEKKQELWGKVMVRLSEFLDKEEWIDTLFGFDSKELIWQEKKV